MAADLHVTGSPDRQGRSPRRLTGERPAITGPGGRGREVPQRRMSTELQAVQSDRVVRRRWACGWQPSGTPSTGRAACPRPAGVVTPRTGPDSGGWCEVRLLSHRSMLSGSCCRHIPPAHQAQLSRAAEACTPLEASTGQPSGSFALGVWPSPAPVPTIARGIAELGRALPADPV